MNTKVTLVLLMVCNMALADFPPLDSSPFSEKEILERRDKAEQAKLDLGAGDLERLALGSTYAHIEKAKMYKGASTDLLYKILRDKRFSLRWHKVATTISIVSDDKGLDALKEYITSPLSETSYKFLSHDIKARGAAMRGLVARFYEEDIEWIKPFLLEHAQDASWSKYKGYEKTKPEPLAKLADEAMLAIARMKTEDAMEMLGKIREQYAAPGNSSTKAQPLSTDTRNKLDRVDMYIQMTNEIADDMARRESEMRSGITN